MQENKTNLLGFTKNELQEFIVSLGGKTYNGTQVFKWIHHFKINDFSKMTDLSKNLRKVLEENCEILPPLIVNEHIAKDGTIKWLISIAGGNIVETVFIPKGKRATLCISSQAGCILNCSFCHTAKQGFSKNLSKQEIIGQLWLAEKRLSKPMTNVVMMGMGEPLLNFSAVKSALAIMRDPLAYQLPRRRLTVSTSGVVPEIYRLAKECDVTLAISLHAPTDELRNLLVPINKKYPIATLLEACKSYISSKPNSKVTIEYVMLKDVNDSIIHAKQLMNLLKQLPCKINLIPFNPFVGTNYQSSSIENIHKFSEVLIKAGFTVTIRLTRGEDINAACGQLAGEIIDKTKRSQRYYANLKSTEITNVLH